MLELILLGAAICGASAASHSIANPRKARTPALSWQPPQARRVEPTFARSVEVPLDNRGHGYVDVSLRSARRGDVQIRMMIDTGATCCLLSHADCARLGIPLGELTYSSAIETASGTEMAASISVPEMWIGGVAAHDVDTAIMRRDAHRQSLLGQSFLQQVIMEQGRGKIILRAM